MPIQFGCDAKLKISQKSLCLTFISTHVTKFLEDVCVRLRNQHKRAYPVCRYEQKDLDCVRLHKLVDDLQRKLEEEKAAREQNFATADQFTSRLRQAENKISEFEYRLQVCSRNLFCFWTSKSC